MGSSNLPAYILTPVTILKYPVDNIKDELDKLPSVTLTYWPTQTYSQTMQNFFK
jgi:hypothetical protein